MLWVRSGNEREVRKLMRQYFADKMEALAGPEPALVRKVHQGMPNSFGGAFPAAIIISTGVEGQHRQEEDMPSEIHFEARAIMPTLGPAGEQLSSKRVAEDICMDIIGEFKDAVNSDDDFRFRIYDVRWGQSTASDATLLGLPRLDQSGNLLWIENLPFRILL